MLLVLHLETYNYHGERVPIYKIFYFQGLSMSLNTLFQRREESQWKFMEIVTIFGMNIP